MANIGEEIVSSYLRHVEGCDFVDTNVRTRDTQGEIDVLGIHLGEKRVYACEVAIHLPTGLQYVDAKTNRPDTDTRLAAKLVRDIDYARTHFPGHQGVFMLWSPIVKQGKKGAAYDQMAHVRAICESVRKNRGEEVRLVINDTFQECLGRLRAHAGKATSEMQCPVMRYLQIEEYLKRHTARHPASP